MDLVMVRVSSADAENIIKSESAIGQALATAGADQVLNLDEAWSGLHFVLTGEFPVPHHEAQHRDIPWDPSSLENALMGGDLTPHMSISGPTRYMSPDQVRRMAEALAAVSIDKFREWYDADELLGNRIPPERWRHADSAFVWLADYFVRLVAHYKAAAASGDGLLIAIS